jgi:BMFP domain-containing protein YqiC
MIADMEAWLRLDIDKELFAHIHHFSVAPGSRKAVFDKHYQFWRRKLEENRNYSFVRGYELGNAQRIHYVVEQVLEDHRRGARSQQNDLQHIINSLSHYPIKTAQPHPEVVDRRELEMLEQRVSRLETLLADLTARKI